MIKNLLLVTIRSLRKRKFYAILNVLGLAASIAFAFLLFLYVEDQNSYDKQFVNAQRIYRVDAVYDFEGKHEVFSNAQRPVALTLKSEYSEVQEAARIRGVGGAHSHSGILEIDETRIRCNNLFVADSTIFRIFDREFFQGDPEKALAEPNAIVIAESLALKLFGTTECLGKSVVLQGSNPKYVKITGIIKDAKYNSHLPVEAYVSWSTFPYPDEMTQWIGAHTYTYIILDQNSDINTLAGKMPVFYEKHMKKAFEAINGKGDLIFQPLVDIHLDDECIWEPNPHSSRTNIAALSVVIIFLIVFACINYVNLATARSAERAAEVGMRKILGSSKGSLIMQFLMESLVLSFVSGLLAMGLCALASPYFNRLADLHFNLFKLFAFRNILYLFLISLAIGLLGGIYPAFYLSSLESLKILKGKFVKGSSGQWLRKILVATQYSIATVLIASILFVGQQVRFIKNKDIGFDKASIIAVTIPRDTTVLRHVERYMDEIRKSTHIADATNSSNSLDREANQLSATFENEDGTVIKTVSDFISVDENFLEAIGVTLVSGRNFIKDSKFEQKQSILINEATVKKLGWTKNPLSGRYVESNDETGEISKYNVIGVVKDFSLGASYQVVNPLIIFLGESKGDNLYIRVKKNETKEGLADIKATWNQLFRGYDLEYTFLDQSLNVLYRKEEKFLDLLEVISVVIIFIASLGIIGLISFTVELKKKEIAIRKILGSSSRRIVLLLAVDFFVLLGVANVVAFPVTWFLVKLWLDHFAYRIDPGAGPFVISFFTCLLFTLCALLYHTIHALLANPVNALRYE